MARELLARKTHEIFGLPSASVVDDGFRVFGFVVSACGIDSAALATEKVISASCVLSGGVLEVDITVVVGVEKDDVAFAPRVEKALDGIILVDDTVAFGFAFGKVEVGDFARVEHVVAVGFFAEESGEQVASFVESVGWFVSHVGGIGAIGSADDGVCIAAAGRGDREFRVVVVVLIDCEFEGGGDGLCFGSFGTLECFLCGDGDEGRENGDDGDYDEELDEGEAAFARGW